MIQIVIVTFVQLTFCQGLPMHLAASTFESMSDSSVKDLEIEHLLKQKAALDDEMAKIRQRGQPLSAPQLLPSNASVAAEANSTVSASSTDSSSPSLAANLSATANGTISSLTILSSDMSAYMDKELDRLTKESAMIDSQLKAMRQDRAKGTSLQPPDVTATDTDKHVATAPDTSSIYPPPTGRQNTPQDSSPTASAQASLKPEQQSPVSPNTASSGERPPRATFIPNGVNLLHGEGTHNTTDAAQAIAVPFHKIEHGESWESVASKYSITVEQLIEFNGGNKTFPDEGTPLRLAKAPQRAGIIAAKCSANAACGSLSFAPFPPFPVPVWSCMPSGDCECATCVPTFPVGAVPGACFCHTP